jgi:hypothetical protein
MSPHQDWENLSDKEEGKLASIEECRSLCVEQPKCMQYSLDQDRTCRTRMEPRLGRAMRGVSSGWVFDRITELQKETAPCGQ